MTIIIITIVLMTIIIIIMRICLTITIIIITTIVGSRRLTKTETTNNLSRESQQGISQGVIVISGNLPGISQGN